MPETNYFVHPTADVHPDALIGEGTKIWNWAQVREAAVIGRLCVLAKGVYIDREVRVGDMVKIQNNVSVYRGVTIEEGVFVGPHACFTNDTYPRSVDDHFEPLADDDWEVAQTMIRRGASIGANVSILAGVEVGEYSLIGLGAVVTKDVAPYTVVYGNPAAIQGRIDKSGRRVRQQKRF